MNKEGQLNGNSLLVSTLVYTEVEIQCCIHETCNVTNKCYLNNKVLTYVRYQANHFINYVLLEPKTTYYMMRKMMENITKESNNIVKV